MACRFKYYVNGVERKLYTELYGYMDTTPAEKKTVNAVHKILRNNGIATKRFGVKKMIYLPQTNVEHSLLEIKRINNEYPGLLTTTYKGMAPKSWTPAAPKYELDINEYILQQIPVRGLETADFVSNDPTDIDQYVRLVAGEENTADYYLSEKVRQENTSEQSKFSDLNKEEIDRVEGKVVHLQDSFASVGVMVEVEYDTEIPSIAQVERKEDGAPIIKVNPNLAKEDTVYHEFGHIYVDLLGVNHPLVQSGIAQLKDTDLYKQVEEKYPELTGERLDKEVLVTAIGLEGAKITRQNPTWIQQLINRIMRAVGNVFGIEPNAAAVLAEEMFAKKLRGDAMFRPLSPYTQYSKQEQRFTETVQNLKIRVANEIYEVEQLPLEQKEKRIYRLKRLQNGLENVKKVEDLLEAVQAMADSLNAAYKQYEEVMSLPRTERATLENMTKIYKLKNELDRLDVMKAIKNSLTQTKKKGNIIDEGRFNTLEERVRRILDRADELEDEFEDDIIPILAEFLSGYHNQNIDPEVQAQIDNIQEYGDWKRRRSMIRSNPDYVLLKVSRANNEITETEFNEKAKKLVIEALKDKYVANYSTLKKELSNAHKDKGNFSYMLDPLIYSNDKAVQLFVKSIQDADLRKNDMTLELKSKLSKEYEEFTKGMSGENVSKLNEDLLEVVTMNGMKRLSMVQPIDIDLYINTRKEYAEELRKTYKKPVKTEEQTDEEFINSINNWAKSEDGQEYQREESEWHRQNSESIEGWRDELNAINKLIGTAKKIQKELREADNIDSDSYAMQDVKLKELRKLKSRNYNQATGTARGDWVRPRKSVYTNQKYLKIQKNPRLKKYYDFVVKEFQVGQKMVSRKPDKNSWDRFSYLMPTIRKEDLNRLYEQGLISTTKDILKDTFTITETNAEFGTYDDNSGELNTTVPVYYINRVDAKDVSKDIASSLYRFRHMAHNFKVKDEAVGYVNLFKDIIENREIIQENSAGVDMVIKTAEFLGFSMTKKKKEGKRGVQSNLSQHLNEWIKMVVFGQSELKSEVGKVSLSQVAGVANKFTAMSTLSFNLLQGANQLILDNLSTVQEAVAGQFISKSDFAWAKAKYWSEAAAIKDITRFDPKTKLGKALDFFDAFTEFTDQEGNKLVGGKARRLLTGDNLLFLQKGAEHELSSTRLLALMRSLKGKLKDKSGNVLQNKKGKDADLYDMLLIDKKTGLMSVDPRVDNFSRLDFINLLQGLGRRTNQTKGKMHMSMLSRRWYGKLFMLFRNWIMPGLRRHYGHGGAFGSTLHVDEEMGTLTQGFVISILNQIQSSIRSKKLVYGELTDLEKQNIKRGYTEIGFMATAAVLVSALANLDDDDESWGSNFALYQAKRYQTEIMQWYPPAGISEMFRIMESPTATARPLVKGWDLFNQLLIDSAYRLGLPVPEEAVFYQRRSGRYAKGDSKLKKHFEDLIPVWRGLTKTSSPEEAYKWFTQF